MATKKQKKLKLKEQRVLIVGGGIAGLEAARQLQEIMELSSTPLHVTLLEHKNRMGGRVHTMRTSPNTFYEAGASRIASTHRRVNDLVKLFHLKPIYNTSTRHNPQQQLIKTFEKIKEKFIKTYDSEMMQHVTWRDILYESCASEEEANQYIKQWGFVSMISNMNAYDFWKYAIPHYCAPQYYTLENGLYSLIEALHTHIQSHPYAKKVDIRLQATLDEIIENKYGKYVAKWNEMNNHSHEKMFDVVFLAIPTDALKTINGLPDSLTSKLNTVSCNSLLRCYVKIDNKKISPNYQNASKTILRRALPSNDPQWIQVSYTDHDPSKHLYNMLTTPHGETFLKTHSKSVVNKWSEMDLHFWKAGTHSWLPKQHADCNYDSILQPDPTKPLFVIGSCFSHAQHWMEGALETVGDAVMALRRLWRSSQYSIHNNHCKYNIPDKKWSMEDVKTNNYVIYENRVFDISNIIPLHPGGAKLLENMKGENITRAFHGVRHSHTAKAWLEQHCIGYLHQ